MDILVFFICILTICHTCRSLLTGYEYTEGVVVEISNDANSFALLNFLYDKGENVTVVAEIIDQPTNLLINGTVEPSKKTGFVNITNEDLTSIEFGTYHLMIRVETEQGDLEVTDLVLFYEEKITGFQIPDTMLALTNSANVLPANIITGSNLDVEWFVRDNISERDITAGNPMEVKSYHTYEVPDDYNVTVVARNSLDETYLTNIKITVIRPVEGFFVTISKASQVDNVTTHNISQISNFTREQYVNENVTNNMINQDKTNRSQELQTEILISPEDEIQIDVYLDSDSRLPLGNLTLDIYYDDSSNESVYIGENFTEFLTNGYRLTHVYMEQGNFIITVNMNSEISCQIMILNVHVWEDISNVSMSSVNIARVYENIIFSFDNIPQKGFNYEIKYGDNVTKDGSSTAFYSHFNVAPWEYSYNQDGVFIVEMRTWNPFYDSFTNYEVRIQFPIPDLTLHPKIRDPPLVLPIPDGWRLYTIKMANNDPTPTNVTCYYSFEPDRPLQNTSVIITKDKSETKWNKFTTDGLKNTTVFCKNDVSNYTLQTQVYMQAVELSDFLISYQTVIGMNKTSRTNGLDENTIIVEDVPVTVEFRVSILNCSRFPFNTYLKYDFGDGSSPTDFATLITFKHTYTIRGEYNITVTIKNNTDLITKTLPIRIGLVDFSVSSFLGSVDSTEFIFNMSGIGNGSYRLDVGSGSIYDVHQDPGQIKHVFTSSGYFVAELVSYNETFKEIMYLQQVIVADYNMTGLSFIIPDKVDLPPGNLTVSVISNPSYPMVTCIYDMRDLINRNIYNMTANITREEPLHFDFTYLTLGNHTVTVTCNNNYDTQIRKHIINVWNECFTVNGIFDRQYSNTSNPMRVFTSTDFDLASRMAVYCSDQSVIFQWKLFTVVSGIEHVPVYEHFPYTPVGNPRGSIRFARGTVPANLYRVTLNVTLQNTWVYEPTYLMFIKSPPFAYIGGGFERNVQVHLKNITLNALNVSYDPELGSGGNQKLEFDWTCKRKNVTSLDALAVKYTSNSSSFEDCSELLTVISRGITVLLLPDTKNQGYAITVNVTLEDMHQDFTQLIYGVFGDPPEMNIKCNLNCDMKYATMLKSDWDGQCLDCEAVEAIKYDWFLEYKDSSNNWIAVQNFDEILETGVHARSLVISPNALLNNTLYRLAVKATGYGRDGEGEARIIFRTNLEPYGGTCSPFPRTGFALTTLFAIKCIGWLDEGLEEERDHDRDSRNNNPLMYEYWMIQPYTDSYGDKQYFKTSLLKADKTKVLIENKNDKYFYTQGEMTATELRLPAGSPEYNYFTELSVRVCDRFGDCMEYKMNVTIKPDRDLEPMNTDDTEKITRLLDTSNRTFSITDAGGNNMGLMRVVSSTVSSYASLNMTLESASEISSPDEILEYGNENISDVQNVLTETTDNFVQEIFNRIPDGVSNVELLPADIILVGKSLDKCIQKTSLVTAEASDHVFSASRELLRNVRKHTRKKPFPMMELDGILEANAEVIGVMSKNLDLYQSAGSEDINNTLTKEMVEQELQRYYDYHPEKYDEFIKKYKTFDNIVEKLYIKRTKIRRRKNRLARIAKRIYKNIFNALDEAFNITSSTVAFAEPEKVIRKENLNVSLEKNHLEHFKNKTVIKRDGFLFDFNNETLENVTATDIQLKVAVFKKSPFLHANGATGVNGQIMKIEVLDEEEQPIDFPLSITISNEGISYYKEYEPLIVEGGSSYMMYFRCQMADPNDVFITYIKPGGVSFDNIEVDELFTLYARSEIIPSEIEFDFVSVVKATDWESNGFKVFIPSGQLQSGDVYIALKPITEDEQSVNATLLSRKRRSIDNVTDTPPDHTTANISVVIVTTGCRVYDEQTESWDPSGCSVLPFSSLNETVCRCSPGAGTLFASTFAIPNMIDFHSVWSKFDITNAAVYGTLIAVIVMYFIIFCILRRLDNRDTGQCLPTFLLDNDFFDTHFYMISVQTGLRAGSATSSNVSFILGGTDADSGVRSLSDGITKKHITNSTNNFILATPEPLGDLVYLRIWHDNSGEGKLQSWYLHRVVITDLHTNEKYIFQCDRWFATDIEDGMIERIIPVLNDINSGFESAFSHTTRINVTENHLWLSLILRPPYSAFSRVQRLSCLLALLLLAMISNAMFFQTEAETVVVADTVRLGSLSFSFKTLYISIIGAVITVPPIFLFTYLFRNTRRHQRQVQREPTIQPITPKLAAINQEENQSHISYVDKLKTMQKLRRRSGKGRRGSIVCREQAKFPTWMRNVAWLLIFIVCAASSFFLILYSMEWGKSKSEEWLTTFILSFVESILIVDPVKVFLLAFLLALILRNQKDDQELHVDLESVRQYSHDNAGLRTETLKDFKMAILSNSVSEQRMEERKKQLKKEKTAKDAFLKFVIHIIFAAILFSISYVNRDQRAFNVKTHISNQLYTSDKAKCGFSKVTSARQFLSWTRKVFVPVLFPTANYNGQSISIRDKYLMDDLTNAKIGLVRMRQVRVKKEKCDVPVDIVTGHFCGAKFDTSKEDKSEYCVGCSKSLTADAWTYTEAKDIWGIPIVGHYNTYSGGGYIQNLHNTKATTLAIVDELVEHFWIDRLTRAVFVEFTLYNPNVNLLCYSIFLAEFLETGHGTNWVDTQCFRPSFLTDATGLFSVLFYFLFILILLYRTKLLITNMKNQKCSFWKGFWNVIDAFICIFGYSGIVVWVGKFVYTKKALNQYYNNKDVFINFQHIVIWDYVFSIILGFLVFISTLRVMSALEYNKRMTALADTLRHGGRAIFQFSVLVFIGLGAFAVLGYLLFGPAVYEYRNIFVTFGSLTNTLIGRNSLDSMIRAAPNFAEVYFFVYAFFVIFTLLTIFAAVLNDSISHVRQEQLQQPEPIGILNVMKNSIKDMFGLVGIHIKRTDSKNERKEDSIHENTVDTQNVLKLMRDVITLNLQEESKNNMSSKVTCGKSSMALSRQNIFLPYDTSRRTSQNKGINAMTYLSDYDETDFEKDGIQTNPSRDYMGFGNRDSLTPDASSRDNTATPRDIGINF